MLLSDLVSNVSPASVPLRVILNASEMLGPLVGFAGRLIDDNPPTSAVTREKRLKRPARSVGSEGTMSIGTAVRISGGIAVMICGGIKVKRAAGMGRAPPEICGALSVLMLNCNLESEEELTLLRERGRQSRWQW